MKRCVLLAVLLIAGCGPITAEDVVRHNAELDHAWCVDIGIDRGDARYPQCRVVAKQQRLEGLSVNTARAAALLGAGVTIMPRHDSLTTYER